MQLLYASRQHQTVRQTATKNTRHLFWQHREVNDGHNSTTTTTGRAWSDTHRDDDDQNNTRCNDLISFSSLMQCLPADHVTTLINNNSQ